MNEDLTAIEAVVKLYLDGVHEGDAAKLAGVFHPTGALTGIRDGAFTIMPRDTWLDGVRSRPSAAAQGLPRHDHVLTIDVADPVTAFVKLRCAIPPRFFIDYLSLLKIDGRWQIAQKVYATEVRS
jgi:hypothetical protein